MFYLQSSWRTCCKKLNWKAATKSHGYIGLMTKQGIYILQANLNYSARAQDLLMQAMVECGTDLAVVSEPRTILIGSGTSSEQ